MILCIKPVRVSKVDTDKAIAYTDLGAVELTWTPDSILLIESEVWVWQHQTQEFVTSYYAFPSYSYAAQARKIWQVADGVGPKLASMLVQTIAVKGLPEGTTAASLSKLVPGIGPKKAAAVLPLITAGNGLLSEAKGALRLMGIPDAEICNLLTPADCLENLTVANLVEVGLARRRV